MFKYLKKYWLFAVLAKFDNTIFKIIQSAFYLETSARKYYIAIRECTKDDFDNNNVGVISIYIIKSEDWDEDYIYRGDGKWTPGINIME